MQPCRRSNRIANLQQHGRQCQLTETDHVPEVTAAEEGALLDADLLGSLEQPAPEAAGSEQASKDPPGTASSRKRGRKQGRPSWKSGSGQSGKPVSSLGRTSLQPSASSAAGNVLLQPAGECDPASRGFLVCFDCRFATTRLQAYLGHVTSCAAQLLVAASSESAPHGLLHRCSRCENWVTNCSNLLSEHLADAHAHASVEASRATKPKVRNGVTSEMSKEPLVAADADSDNPSPASPPAPPDDSGDADCSRRARLLGRRQLPHACPDCGKRFGMRYRLMRHRLAMHEAAAAAAATLDRQQPKRPAGGKKILKKASLKDKAAGVGKFACRICCKLFKSRSSYLVHRLAFHAASASASSTAMPEFDTAAPGVASDDDANCMLVTDPEPFKCRFCDEKFSQKTAFARHQAHNHPHERPYSCRDCGRGFKFQHSLAMHVRLHRGELTCQKCQRIFHSDREYSEHQASVHEGSLTFLCESCGRTFPTQYKLSRHGRVHNRSRQHACPQCGRHFHRMDKLKLHLQCVHSTDRPHLCHLCGRAFNRRDKLAEHLKQHSEHRCQSCPAAFPSRTELRRHVNSVHRPPRAAKSSGSRRARGGRSRSAKLPADVEPPAPPLPPQQPSQPLEVDILSVQHQHHQGPPSPLGDALITIATGGGGGVSGDILQQQQIIFLDAFDPSQHPQHQELLHQCQFPHNSSATLTLYSPISGTYYTANAIGTVGHCDAAAVDVALADVVLQ